MAGVMIANDYRLAYETTTVLPRLFYANCFTMSLSEIRQESDGEGKVVMLPCGRDAFSTPSQQPDPPGGVPSPSIPNQS